MQKKLIALAVAGLMAAPAFAQSNVTIYGRIDYGFMSRTGTSGGVKNALTDPASASYNPAATDGKTEFASGMEGGSRLGFKGAEDLGNGLKAIFELEFGSIANDTNGGLNGSRHAYVGLTGGFGTVVGGRLDGVRYGVFNKYDPFAGGGMGNFTQVTGQVDRADNAVAYISPSFGGFSVVAAYSSNIGASNGLGFAGLAQGQEHDGNRGDLRLNTIMLTYANGPISANLDWERVYAQGGKTVNLNTVAAPIYFDKEVVTTIAGAYDFGVVKVSALYDINKVKATGAGTVADYRSWFLGAKAPIGSNVVLKAVYGQTKDREVNKSKTKKFGIGADYLLSKRTNFYVDYGTIRNDDNAAVTISPAANAYGATGKGYGTRGFDLGIAHKF
ncbi:porin [Nitrogeniibacter mangrovi]|uniref:Porin n=1 Tax=Nitrogeniibacter mangrovi TaxID=2016596 RepID=A0A6C1B6V9_9RHOO|nr:porin [Nitrogeniibacter mangrovi]QID18555.1 porin [Nitrogeniibacter mangrovi]